MEKQIVFSKQSDQQQQQQQQQPRALAPAPMGSGSDVFGNAPGMSWHMQHCVPDGSCIMVSPVVKLGMNCGTWKDIALP